MHSLPTFELGGRFLIISKKEIAENFVTAVSI